MRASPTASSRAVASSVGVPRPSFALRSRRAAIDAGPEMRAARAALEQAGVRATQTRLLVYSVFVRGVREAMPADRVLKALFERGEVLSLSTVYAALRQLDAARLIISHYENGRRVYEQAGTLPSARVACDVCGTERVLRDARLDALLREVVSGAGFELGDYRLLVSVTCGEGCPVCRKRRP